VVFVTEGCPRRRCGLTGATKAWPVDLVERLPEGLKGIATFSVAFEHIDTGAAPGPQITATNIRTC